MQTKDGKESRVSALNEKIPSDFYLRVSSNDDSMELLFKGHFLK